ncbi:uncharacterized protein N7483_007780 [Penicillium malachiteum]|uniref:uncharacterized protein n=1 Tax=Penicillium malachiteum TaxID=1324776 RepID=UPI002546C306|nr:uncharacterized protein N7483_007780 [Penicillium malachiteum]KAJ5726423.1 hypothetical protein N7483_007780 [Penicillium malachiteum]
MSNDEARPPKVWTTLITNTDYLPGLLTLDFSLKKVNSKYPLVALYTDSFSAEGHKALDARGILKQRVDYLLPSTPKEYDNDPRFYDCWSKLTPFSLVEYERVVQLDSDMLVLKNMDELMEMELDPPSMAGNGNRVFAACHACACNPLNKSHYPADWIPKNCAYTSQHSTPDEAQITGPDPNTALGMPNGGLQVVNPSKGIYDKIVARLADTITSSYDFADQSLLGDVFSGRWVALPYIYNALKTLRWEGVHDSIWRDGEVKNVHYILSPKPWNEWELHSTDWSELVKNTKDKSHVWWFSVNEERKKKERLQGIVDSF